jgi:alkylhydroperoxidase/carboxymuconolactone decarboxylase family protein YurZ
MTDAHAVEAVLRTSPVGDGPALDDKTNAFVRLAALIALHAAPSSYGWSIEHVLAAGGTDDDIVAVILAVAPVVGVARTNRASAEIATAIGYDLDLPDWQ